jgi:hypothetical protein
MHLYEKVAFLRNGGINLHRRAAGYPYRQDQVSGATRQAKRLA